MINKSLHTLKFALSAGIVTGLCVAIITIFGITGLLGGLDLWNDLLLDIYGNFGYDITWIGVLLGLIYGFIDGFIFFGLISWIYNAFIGKES